LKYIKDNTDNTDNTDTEQFTTSSATDNVNATADTSTIANTSAVADTSANNIKPSPQYNAKTSQQSQQIQNRINSAVDSAVDEIYTLISTELSGRKFIELYERKTLIMPRVRHIIDRYTDILFTELPIIPHKELKRYRIADILESLIPQSMYKTLNREYTMLQQKIKLFNTVKKVASSATPSLLSKLNREINNLKTEIELQNNIFKLIAIIYPQEHKSNKGNATAAVLQDIQTKLYSTKITEIETFIAGMDDKLYDVVEPFNTTAIATANPNPSITAATNVTLEDHSEDHLVKKYSESCNALMQKLEEDKQGPLQFLDKIERNIFKLFETITGDTNKSSTIM
jgi:hypothetical protein